jgi:DNA repair exonuclease SbcCD ATPase subunit
MGKKNIPDHYVLNNNINIKKIYHIADIHIRKYERHDEYINIFNKLCDQIKKDCKDSLIVCCGDILHEGITGDAIIIVKKFFINLCELCDVVVFKGNHDLSSRSNIDAIDSLTPILMKLETKNKLHVLDFRGLYEYGNLLFGYTTMYDEKIISPQYDKFENKIKIALWHGIIHGCTNNDGFSLSNNSKFNQTDFVEYDYVMLGDVHKFQYLNKNKTIAYCGSLIQQNHGESIENHGCIKWDLIKKKSEFIHINNDHGYLTVRIENNVISKYNLDTLPKNLNLKIIQKKSLDIHVEKIKNIISKKVNIKQCNVEKIDFGYSLEDITLSSNKKLNREKKDSDSDSDSGSDSDSNSESKKNTNKPIGTIQNDEMAIKILNQYIDVNYNFSKKEKEELNDALFDMIKNIKYEYLSTEKNIKLKEIYFNNFNVYSSDNFIDYKSLNGIINICGKNGIGKSSAAVYVLLYAIYGNYDNISKHDYINIKKKDMSTKIILDINDVEYSIEREEKIRGKNKIEYSSNVRLYKKNKDISGKSIIEIEKQIINLLGESDKLINLCIMSQKKCNSFVDLSDNEKKKFLCDILKLDVYNNIGKEALNQSKILNTKLNEKYKIIYKDQKNKIGDNEKIIDDDIIIINDDLQKIGEELIVKQKLYDSINHKKIETNIKIEEYKNINTDNNPQDYIKNNKKNIEEKIKCKNFINELNEELDDLNYEKTQNIKNIKKYKNIDDIHKQFISSQNKDIKKLEDELKQLYIKLGYIGKTDYCEKDIKIKKKDIIKFNEKIEKLKDTIDLKEKNIKLNKKKIIKIKYEDTLEEKYEEFKNTDKLLGIMNQNIDNLNNKLINYENHYDIIKNHKYNKKCKECISNKTTQDKIEIEKNIYDLKNELKIINREHLNLKKKHSNLKCYETKINEKKENSIVNEKLNLLIKCDEDEIYIINNEINNLNDNIKFIEKNIDIYQNNNKLNIEIEETANLLKKKKEEKDDNYIEYLNLIDLNKKVEQKIIKKELDLEREKISLEKIKKNILEINNKIKENEDNIEKYKIFNKLNDEKEKLMKDYNLINLDIIDLREKKDRLTIELTKAQYNLENIINSKKEISDYEKLKNLYDKIVNIINGGFVDKLLTESVIPKFMSSVNGILSSFVSFKIKMLHEDNKKIVVYKDDMTNVLKLSGYESLMVNVAFRLAINQVNKKLRTNFFIMDESFSFCDDSGISKISNLFEYMRELYDWIIVVSHNDQIKTYTDIDLCVETKDDFSFINTNKFIKNINKIHDSDLNINLVSKNIKDKKIKKKI